MQAKSRSQRRRVLAGLSALPLLPLTGVRAAQGGTAASPPRGRLERLVLAGPPATVSYGLVHLVESGALADVAESVEFALWSNPDQLRALALDGKAGFIATPTNVAANLYNRGVPLTLLNVSVWGILWMVSRRPDMKTLADFKGQEIAVPFRADMPDIVFGFLSEKQGLDPRKDFKLRYTSTPMDAVQLLAMRQVDHALLAEPAVSLALRKTRSFPISTVAPDLYRSVNLQEEWGRVLEREPRIPQAGIAALGAARQDAGLLTRFEAAYADSVQWCAEHPRECGAMVAKHISMMTPEAVADSLQFAPRHYATAAQARAELEYFYGLLHARQPATVGGRLPDAAFYQGAQAQG